MQLLTHIASHAFILSIHTGVESWGWGLRAEAFSHSVGIEIFCASDFCRSVYGLASEVVFTLIIMTSTVQPPSS